MEAIQKLLLIGFGIVILYLVLTWAFPQFANVQETKEKGDEADSNEDDKEINNTYLTSIRNLYTDKPTITKYQIQKMIESFSTNLINLKLRS